MKIFRRVNIENGKDSLCFNRYLSRCWESQWVRSLVYSHDLTLIGFAGGGSAMSQCWTSNFWQDNIISGGFSRL